MEESPKAESRTSKILKLILKIAVTIVCLWYVSGKIDFAVAGKALAKANWFYLFLAFIMFLLSKIISAQRLNIYFRNIGINMPANQNLRLYWLGMFYNLFLPGSISGDAYKVVLLTRKYKIPYKKTTAAVLLDRFSGLLGLGLILAVYGAMVLKNDLYIASITAAAILGLILFYLFIKYYFPDFLESFFPTLVLGILVQAAQVVCVYLILSALGIGFHSSAYIFIFLVSSIVSVLPLTIGGLGIREVVFLEGSAYFALQQESSVLISLLFYLITLVTSAFGILEVFKRK